MSNRGISFKDEKIMTQQNYKTSCDINVIVKRAQANGMLPDNGKIPYFADLTTIPDYQKSLDIVINAERQFMALPAETRAKFRNDPGELIKFVQDDQNYDEAVKLGLVTIKVEEVIPETTSSKKKKVVAETTETN